MSNLRSLATFLCLLMGFCSLAHAESVPEFAFDYACSTATHLVIVDAKGAVVESWRGDLKRGDVLPFPAAKKPIPVEDPFPREVRPPREAKVPEVTAVTGERRVLFLKRGKGKGEEEWTPCGFLKAEIQYATVWVEKGQCFANYQFENPGTGAQMLPLYMDEARLKHSCAVAKETK